MRTRGEWADPVVPPLIITATNRSHVTVNYKVKVIVQEREQDTLRRWAADLITRGQLVSGATIE